MKIDPFASISPEESPETVKEILGHYDLPQLLDLAEQGVAAFTPSASPDEVRALMHEQEFAGLINWIEQGVIAAMLKNPVFTNYMDELEKDILYGTDRHKIGVDLGSPKGSISIYWNGTGMGYVTDDCPQPTSWHTHSRRAKRRNKMKRGK